MENPFSAFSDPIRNSEALAQAAAIKSFPAKTTVVSHMDGSKSVYFILEGSVDVINFSSQGREVWHSRLEAGQQFGEMSAINDAPRSANILTVTDTVTAIISKAEFIRIIKADAELSFWFLKNLATRLEISTRQTYETIVMNVPKRMCAELARRAPTQPDKNGEYPVEPAPVLAQLARQLNTDRETISRSISVLSKDGVIRRENRKLTIVDREELIARSMD